jgi:hypothetical protein
MNDLQQQIAELRARMERARAACDARFARSETGHAASPRSGGGALHDFFEFGQEIETPLGRHFEAETFFPAHRRHGSADIGALSELPPDLLQAISAGESPAVSPSQWAFLDTETTGLAGGTGTCAFLAGVGRITPDGFRVRQFFMRDYAEEASLLYSLAEHLAPFRVLITYNGRTFDQPLLETRYRMNRTRPPFARLDSHVDLLLGARRLWKLRYERCRLVDLETNVLGFERQGDVPGALIPYLYFEYVRTRRAARLLPVFHHNRLDILTLACLTGIVPCAFKDPSSSALPLKHGTELLGLARWLRQSGELEQARSLFARAVDAGLNDDLLFRTLWDLTALDRKLGETARALERLEELAATRNPFRVRALEELAKHHEHHTRDYRRALELTRSALAHEDSAALRHREQRLLRRIRS